MITRITRCFSCASSDTMWDIVGVYFPSHLGRKKIHGLFTTSTYPKNNMEVSENGGTQNGLFIMENPSING